MGKVGRKSNNFNTNSQLSKLRNMKFNLEIRKRGMPAQHQDVEADGCIEALNQVLDSNEEFAEKNVEKIVCELK